jgi:hypothetical protein
MSIYGYDPAPPTYANTIYYGSFIAVVIYNHVTQTIGGKQFAFVKEKVILGNITFL